MKTFFRVMLETFAEIGAFLFVLLIVAGLPFAVIEYGDSHRPVCVADSSGQIIFAKNPDGSSAKCTGPEKFEPKPFKTLDILRFVGVALLLPGAVLVLFSFVVAVTPELEE